MSLFDAIILGFIQGVTEFLPISSSGHLVIGNHFLKIFNDNILFEVFVHLGTLVAILYFYRFDIIEILKGSLNKDKKYLEYVYLLMLSTIPAISVGFLFNNQIKNLYDIGWVSMFLIITGLVLFLSKFSNQRSIALSPFYVLIIGVFQAFAILPGISRSGMTIGIALLLGINKKDASKFSFFMAIPVILGAVLLELINISDIQSVQVINLFIGFLVAALTGYFSINWLIKIIDRLYFWKFSFYVWLVSFIIICYA